jgi:hypothetical protein
MAQITIYVDERTRRQIARAAKAARVSVSTWVRDKLAKAVREEWPPGYFDLFGSLRDAPIKPPPELDVRDDAPRARL